MEAQEKPEKEFTIALYLCSTWSAKGAGMLGCSQLSLGGSLTH